MVNYLITRYKSDALDLDAALAALEATLETVDTTKTIRGCGVTPSGSAWQAWAIYDT